VFPAEHLVKSIVLRNALSDFTVSTQKRSQRIACTFEGLFTNNHSKDMSVRPVRVMFVSLQALKKELANQKLEAQKAWYRFEKAEEGKNVAPEWKPDWKAEKANPAVEAKPCHSCIVDFYDLYGRQI